MADYFGKDLDRAASAILFVCALGILSLIAWIVFAAIKVFF